MVNPGHFCWWVLNGVIITSVSYLVTVDASQSFGIGIIAGSIGPMIFYPYRWIFSYIDKSEQRDNYDSIGEL